MPMKRAATIYSLISKENVNSSDDKRKKNETGPSASVIRNILNYSKALSVLHTKDAGMIHLVLN